MKELLKFCRYYDGGGSPKGNKTLWGYEKTWVELVEEESRLLDEYVSELHNYLPTWFNSEYAPLSLKALLLNRYLHFCSCFDETDFKRWFHEIYMAGN